MLETNLILVGVAALILLAVVALEANARAYIKSSERRWPPLGEVVALSHGAAHIAAAGPEDGAPVLLVHGASANLRELWTPIAKPLAETHRVIAIDRPGYGYSTRFQNAQSLGAQAAFMAEALACKTQEPVFVIAHSLGAAIALRLAHDFPERVRGLVLAAPASHPYPGGNAWWAHTAATPVIGAAFSRWLVPLLGPAMAKGGVANTFAPADPPADYLEDAGVGLAFRPSAFRASAQDVVATKTEFVEQAALYPEMLVSCIVITADADRVVSPQIHARGIVEDLGAAELICAPGAGHMPHRVRPDLILNALHRLQGMASVEAED